MIEPLTEQIAKAHQEQLDCITRLRLLAPAEVIAAAVAMHEAEHRVVDLCLATAVLDDELMDALAACHRQRQDFLVVARAGVGVPGAVAGIGDHV
ncbi:hypothetical protein KIH74_29850 [Kineosporia sp. J2-2]|uniref:Uncharacterized protein n=1 Tax=Kineosporia corallincola TaxID=2835133 RepID=A0ABS5TQ99_9ACTN|nr:hypothetical protein [Kineosporia corallincola]MBT0773185.1 hypothetical protein [Kineosporia corallincola]